MIRYYASDALKRCVHRAIALPHSRNRCSKAAQDLHPTPSPKPSTASPPPPDPYKLLAHQLAYVREKLTSLLSFSTTHAGLADIAQFYFLHPSTQIRPLLVLLFARATNGLGHGWETKRQYAELEDNFAAASTTQDPLTRSDVLNDWNPSQPDLVPLSQPVSSYLSYPPTLQPSPTCARHQINPTPVSPVILPTQLRLAQIVEMIHIASFLHYDVSDTTHPSGKYKPAAFGDKLSILGGDFLLGRASAAVSRLGDSRVVELISSVIANMAEGEVLQTRRMPGSPGSPTIDFEDAWNLYLQRAYLKSASLLAKGARGSVILGGGAEGQVSTEVAYVYGRNLGIALQLLDDILEYDSWSGSPARVNFHSFSATGPVLYAWEEHPEMRLLLARHFEQEGDMEMVQEYVRRSSGVERSWALARQYADKAKEILQLLPDSDAKMALEVLSDRILERT